MLTGPYAALFDALSFADSNTARLERMDARQWRELVTFCDRTQLTIPLLERCPQALPVDIRARFHQAAAKTATRAGHIRAAFSEISSTLRREGIEFAVLKGFANAPAFFPDARRRVQYDLDLFLPGDSAPQAADSLRQLGYGPLRPMERFPTDHLPVMIRKTGWQWRDDFFDPEIPVSVDIHFRLWDDETEGFSAPGWEQFWERRENRQWDGVPYVSFCEGDLLGYHCLHLLRHLLRGSLRLSHVYELSAFLDTHSEDDSFWRNWTGLHSGKMRHLEAVTFALACRWFGCQTSAVVAREIALLPENVTSWIDDYGFSPVVGIGRPNKHELWLHMSLLDSHAVRASIVRRRLLPARLPGPVDAIYVPDVQLTPRIRWTRNVKYAKHVVGRIAHHLRVLPGVAWHGMQWVLRTSAIGRLPAGYWRFLGAAASFNLGAFIVYVLYNLYLLDLGYQEDMLGWIASTSTAGAIAGTLPAGRWLRAAGLRWGLVSCFLLMAAASVGRILITSPAGLLGFSFVSGAGFALFAVAVAPSIAALTDERARPSAFSIFFAFGISLGILGGFLAGQLVAWLGSIRAALLTGCALIAAAALPGLRIRGDASAPAKGRTFPRGPFIWRFLTVIVIWTGAIGAFSPFFNAYFAREFEASVQQIGAAYSLGQVAQVLAILTAPFLLRRMGLSRGVALTQILSGAALLLLVGMPTAGLAAGAIAYAGFMGFHYMGEPGLYSLLMKRIAPEERSGASSMHSLAMFSAQAIAVALSGMLVARSGYTPVILIAATMAMLAAILLRRTLPDDPAD